MEPLWLHVLVIINPSVHDGRVISELLIQAATQVIVKMPLGELHLSDVIKHHLLIII